MSGHTPGQVRANDNPAAMSVYCILSESRGTGFGASIATVNQREGFNSLSPEEAAANLRRFVACWNACEGISTENLEENQPVKVLADRYNKLLDALKDAHPHIADDALRTRLGNLIAGATP